MLWQINQQAVAAGKVEFKLTFSNGDRLLVDAMIQGPNGQPVGSGGAAPTAGADDTQTEAHRGASLDAVVGAVGLNLADPTRVKGVLYH